MQLLNEVFRDSFLYLSRWELDAAAITCHTFHAIVDEQMTRVCLRRLEKAGINRDTIFLLRDERARFTVNRIELSQPGKLGPYLRSTSVGLLSFSFDEPLKSKSFGAVMDGLLDSATTMVVEKMRFDDGAFLRAEFARITHLCRTFMSLGQLVFDGCTFPAESEQFSWLSAYQKQRHMDDEVVEFLRNSPTSISGFYVSFAQARVSRTFVQKILRTRIDLAERFSLSITGDPQSGLEEYQSFRERHRKLVKTKTTYTFVELKLSVCLETGGSIYVTSLPD